MAIYKKYTEGCGEVYVDNLASFKISYKQMMQDIGKYAVERSDVELTEEEKQQNALIDSVSSFNAAIYTSVVFRRGGMTVVDTIDDHFYNICYINGLNLKRDLGEGQSSIALYNINDLEIRLLEKDSESGNYEEPTFEGVDSEDMYIDLYLRIESIDTNTFEEVFYHIRQRKASDKDENEPADDPDEQENEFILVDPFDLSGDYGEHEPSSRQDSSTTYDIQVSTPEYEKYVFVNSTSLYEINHNPIFYDNERRRNVLKTSDNCVKIKFDPSCLLPFSVSLNVSSTKLIDGQLVALSKTITYQNKASILEVTGNPYPRATKLNRPNASYALLRTNPKLTGNIKVVVDSKNNIYLDTFKISNILSQRRYRHIKVDASEYYGQTLMRKFGDIPAADLYKIEDKCFTLFTSTQTYSSQYYDTYFSGVKTNDDKLYAENFAMFAPLCVKDIIPDFFLIFKVNKNVEEYDEEKMTDTEKLNFFLKNGALIKSFDMRKDSDLGKYVRNISENAAKEVGDIFVSYETTNYDKFIGISLDRGVVSSIYETPFKRDYVHNQVAMNEFYTRGFERNHLVSKNIINFEFMFDDTTSELFSIDTYFGLYVKVNEQDKTFSCIGKTIDLYKDLEDIENLLTLDVSTYIYDTSINDFPVNTNLNTIPEYSTLIYGVTTPNEFIRLKTGLIDSSINENFIMKPYKNIASIHVNKIESNACKGFLTVKLNNILEVGDHIKLIDKDNHCVYEILLSNIPSEYNDEHNVSDVTSNFYNYYGSKWNVYRVSMYIPFRRDVNSIISEDENPGLESFISSQVEQLFYAIRKFDAGDIFTSWVYNNTTLSIVSYVDNLVFERICSPSGFTDVQKKYLITYEGENETLQFFGNTYAKKTLLIVDNDLIDIKDFCYLYPFDFEIVGNRIGYSIDFLPLNILGDDYVYYGKLDDLTVFDTKTILYKVKNDSSIYQSIYNSFDVSYTSNSSIYDKIKKETSSLRYVQSYLDLDSYFYNVHSPFLQADTLLLYDTYPINVGICSIFNLKDFDYDVLDAESVLSNRLDDEPVGTAGEFSKTSVFNDVAEDIEINEDDIEQPTTGEYIDELDTSVYTGSLQDLMYDEDFLMKDAANSTNVKITLAVASATKYTYQYPVIAYDKSLNNFFDADFSLKPFIKGTAVPNYTDYYYNKVVRFMDYTHWCEKNQITPYIVYVGTYDQLVAEPYLDFPDFSLISLQPVVDEKPEFYNYAFYDRSNTLGYGRLINLGSRVGVFHVVGELPPIKSTFVTKDNIVVSTKPIRNTSEENIKDYIDKYNIYDSSTLKKFDINGTSIEALNNRNDYLESLISGNHYDLDISLISPYACKWKGIGTDARGEDLRIMNDYIDASGNSIIGDSKSYYCVGADNDLYNKYLGFLQYISKNSEENPRRKYIVRSPNMYTYQYDSSYNLVSTDFGIPYRDSILYGNATIDDLLYDSVDSKNKFSTVYISGENTIEFISGGVKLRIKSTNDNVINLNKYKGYSAVFVSLPDIHMQYSKETELIIDEKTREMIFIWYQPVNTFRIGATYFNDSSDIKETNTYVCRIKYNTTFNDIKCIYLENDSFARIPDDNKFSTTQEYDKDNVEERWSLKETNIPTGRKLCNALGYIYLSSIHIDPNAYTKYNNIVFTGRLYDFSPITKHINERHAYYLSDDAIYVSNPILWHNEYNEPATIATMNKYCYDYHESIDAYLYTDDSRYIVNNVGTYDDLKSSVASCAVYVKSNEGLKDYSKFDGLLNISVINPIEYIKNKDLHFNIYGRKEQKLGYAHSTYAEPVMKDMFVFGYNSFVKAKSLVHDSDSDEAAEIIQHTLVDNVFKKSFDGANVILSDVNTINQIWFNKYTDEANFCIKDIKTEIFNEDSSIATIKYSHDSKVSIDVKKNVSLLSTSWSKDFNRKYFSTDENRENYDVVPGYMTGYEKKTFINSRGINLNGSNGKTIEITSWKNTEISDDENYIKLDITDSIIYNILFRNAFTSAWRYLKLTNNTYKINYIKNTILPFININNKTKFILYKGNQVLNNIHFNSDHSDLIGKEIKNYKNELKFENGKYYMYVYPEELTTYTAKMIIEL